MADLLLSSGVCAQAMKTFATFCSGDFERFAASTTTENTMQVSPEHLSATPERPKQAKHLVGTAGGVNDALKLLLEEVGLSDRWQTRG